MKKIAILFFSLALCLPINTFAYTYFIAADDLAADDLLAGVTIDPDTVSDVASYSAFLVTGGSATFSPSNDSINGVSPSGFAIPGTVVAVSYSTNVIDPGLLFYYTSTEALGLPQLLGAAIDPGTGVVSSSDYFFDAAQTINFGSFTLSGVESDSGSVYTISKVPVPSALFLLAPGLLALFGLRRRVAR